MLFFSSAIPKRVAAFRTPAFTVASALALVVACKAPETPPAKECPTCPACPSVAAPSATAAAVPSASAPAVKISLAPQTIACQVVGDCTAGVTTPVCAEPASVFCHPATPKVCTWQVKKTTSCPCILGDLRACSAGMAVKCILNPSGTGTTWSSCDVL